MTDPFVFSVTHRDDKDTGKRLARAVRRQEGKTVNVLIVVEEESAFSDIRQFADAFNEEYRGTRLETVETAPRLKAALDPAVTVALIVKQELSQVEYEQLRRKLAAENNIFVVFARAPRVWSPATDRIVTRNAAVVTIKYNRARRDSGSWRRAPATFTR